MGITQEILAEKIGVDKNTVWRWEKEYSNPPVTVVKKLCDVFNITESELLNGPERNEFVVSLKFTEVLEGVTEEMMMNGIALTVADNGFIGVSGGKKFESKEDIEAVLADIREKLEEGWETRERMSKRHREKPPAPIRGADAKLEN